MYLGNINIVIYLVVTLLIHLHLGGTTYYCGIYWVTVT